jgi:hypothetical protein
VAIEASIAPNLDEKDTNDYRVFFVHGSRGPLSGHAHDAASATGSIFASQRASGQLERH